MSKLKQGIIFPTPEEDAAITAAALSDADARPYTDEEWEAVKPTIRRGRPVGSGTKAQVTVRIDIDILEAFRSGGEGWQTRMNDALKQWLKENPVNKRA